MKPNEKLEAQRIADENHQKNLRRKKHKLERTNKKLGRQK